LRYLLESLRKWHCHFLVEEGKLETAGGHNCCHMWENLPKMAEARGREREMPDNITEESDRAIPTAKLQFLVM
jgi:hypothetical protein